MSEPITRRAFLKYAAGGAMFAALDPVQSVRWLSGLSQAGPTVPSALVSSTRWHDTSWSSQRELISDDDIPTQYFNPGYTQAQLDQAWQTGDLRLGFPYGLIDTHTLGGVPAQRNITVDTDGSAVLAVRRPDAQELANWQADAQMQAGILAGEQNGLAMRVAVAACTGRLPTDVRTVEATITLPQRIITGDAKVGMVGTGWTLWTLPDLERLAANLAQLRVSEAEIQEISTRINGLEEDIAEFSLGRPSEELGYPLWTRLIGGPTMIFLAGRKTPTRLAQKADIMHVFFQPLDASLLGLFGDRTLTGWLPATGGDSQAALKKPLNVRWEIGDPVYDSTRDVMVAPMQFSLNGKRLTPTAQNNYPGFETDPTGSSLSNLSIWQMRTRQGDWFTVPRMFVINFCSSRKQVLEGQSDYIRISGLNITRRSGSGQM